MESGLIVPRPRQFPGIYCMGDDGQFDIDAGDGNDYGKFLLADDGTFQICRDCCPREVPVAVWEGFNIISGTIFDGNNPGINPGSYTDAGQVYQGTTTSSGTVTGTGLIVTCILDTTDCPAGNCNLHYYVDANGRSAGETDFLNNEESVSFAMEQVADEGSGDHILGIWRLDADTPSQVRYINISGGSELDQAEVYCQIGDGGGCT